VALIILAGTKGQGLAERYLSVNAGYLYSHWEPSSIDDVKYNTTGLNGGFIELNSPYYSQFINKPLFRYEWTPGDKDHQELIEQKLSESTLLEKTYERYLVYIPLRPLVIKYEREVFIADLNLETDRTYYSSSDGGQRFTAGETITEAVVFEEVSAHLTEPFDNWYYGLSYGKFQKPFSLVGTSDPAIYDAKLDYFSLDVGFSRPHPGDLGWAFLYDICASIGRGDIELTATQDLNRDILGDDHFVNSWGLKCMLGAEYNTTWLSIGVACRARVRDYDLNRSRETENEYGLLYDKVARLNRDSIFKAEVSLAARF